MEIALKVDVDTHQGLGAGVPRLMRALIGRGIFLELRDGRYTLTPIADALRTDAPVSMGGWARFCGSHQYREFWSALVDAVRTGYVAECYWDGVRKEDLREVVRRIEASMAAVARDGGPVRYLGWLHIVDDDVVLVLF